MKDALRGRQNTNVLFYFTPLRAIIFSRGPLRSYTHIGFKTRVQDHTPSPLALPVPLTSRRPHATPHKLSFPSDHIRPRTAARRPPLPLRRGRSDQTGERFARAHEAPSSLRTGLVIPISASLSLSLSLSSLSLVALCPHGQHESLPHCIILSVKTIPLGSASLTSGSVRRDLGL